MKKGWVVKGKRQSEGGRQGLEGGVGNRQGKGMFVKGESWQGCYARPEGGGGSKSDVP